MYFRGNQFTSVYGPHTVLGMEIQLAGRPGEPATVRYEFQTRLRRLVLGLRARLGAAEGRWRLLLDGRHLVTPVFVAGGRGLRHSLVELDLPAADGGVRHALEVSYEGAAPAELHDVILRARGLGEDPIGDELLIEEGRYWSRFVQLHLDAGNRSIIDAQVKGTHTTFLVHGIRQVDHRDRHNRLGFYPDSASEFLLEPYQALRGGVGLDVGTGGGQWALEGSRQGLRMLAVDVGAGLLAIARRYYFERRREEPELRIDHIRAEGSRLPLRARSMDIVSAKESLHHLGEIEQALAEIKRVMKPGAELVSIDHLNHAAWLDKLFMRTNMLFRPLIFRRHAMGPIPVELNYESPLEGEGGHDLLPAYRRAFACRRWRTRYLYGDLVAAHVEYAFGRQKWLLGPILRGAAYAIETAINLVYRHPMAAYMRASNPK